MISDFSNKTAVLTGAGSGFGLEMARIGARLGMNLVLADVQQDALDKTTAEMQAAGARVLAMRLDVSSATQMAALGEAPPGEIHSLVVTELRANVAGAALTGAGSFTFDNTDLTTFEGVPAPTGKIDLKLIGGNGLMDKLVAMGLLSEEDVMGARMMLSMFANAGPGEDELNSTLEFKDKGFFANGQQLQ